MPFVASRLVCNHPRLLSTFQHFLKLQAGSRMLLGDAAMAATTKDLKEPAAENICPSSWAYLVAYKWLIPPEQVAWATTRVVDAWGARKESGGQVEVA